MGERIRVQASEINLGLSYPPHVFYAGESARRLAFIEHAFDRSKISSFPVGPEPQALVEDVMRFKLEVGLKTVPEGFVGAIVVADTQTVIPKVENGKIEMVSRGKPKNLQELFDSLLGMKHMSGLTGESPFYQVDSASGLIHLNGRQVQVEDRQSCLVVLRKKKLEELATERGFLDYLQIFTRFYSQPPYSTHNMKPITPTDLSGGLSLPVLTKMGIVQSVSGVDVMEAQFRDILKHNVHLVAVGISPRILESVQVDSKKMIYGWDWLNEVVDHALS